MVGDCQMMPASDGEALKPQPDCITCRNKRPRPTHGVLMPLKYLKKSVGGFWFKSQLRVSKCQGG